MSRTARLTVYLQVGSDDRSSWSPSPRLVKATTRSDVVTHDDTVSTIAVQLVLPEELFRRSKPQHHVVIDVDADRAALAPVTAEQVDVPEVSS